MTAFDDPHGDANGATPRDPAVTGIMHGRESGFDFPPPAYDAYDVPVAPEPAVYKREPVFSKKVMILWASLALGAWFMVKMVVPMVFVNVKDTIKGAIEKAQVESRNGHGPQKITIVRDGKVITIETGPNGTTVTKTAADVTPAPAAAPGTKASGTGAIDAPAALPAPEPPEAATKKR